MFWLSVLITGLVLFAVASQDIFGETLLIISVMILAIPLMGYGIFKLSRGMPNYPLSLNHQILPRGAPVGLLYFRPDYGLRMI